MLVASNRFGTATSTVATVTVTGFPPSLVLEPRSQSAAQGSTVTLTAAATGSNPLGYQWRFNGADIAGGTNPSLVLTNVQGTNAGSYRFIVTNAFGFALSSNAVLALTLPVANALNPDGLTWTTSGSVPWFGQTTVTHGGVCAAQSGSITDDQQSVLAAAVTGPGVVRFWWKVSCEPNWDSLRLLVSGTEVGRISGELGWEQRSFAISAGGQSLQWVYAKDGNASVGQDAAWVDEVTYTTEKPAPQLLHPFRFANSFGVSVLATVGQSYVLEYKNVLSDSIWTIAMTVAGDGTMRVLTDTNAVGVATLLPSPTT